MLTFNLLVLLLLLSHFSILQTLKTNKQTNNDEIKVTELAVAKFGTLYPKHRKKENNKNLLKNQHYFTVEVYFKPAL
jgi:hypothetical protein